MSVLSLQAHKFSVKEDFQEKAAVQSNHGVIYCRNKSEELGFSDLLKPFLGDGDLLKGTSFVICSKPEDGSYPRHKPIRFPLVWYSDESYKMCNCEAHLFKYEDYFGELMSRTFGVFIICFDLIPSTMDIVHELSQFVPSKVIAIASRQTNGRGRGSTKWESPSGCSMFTFNAKFSTESEIGRHPAYLGYITSVSIIQAIISLPGYEHLDLKIKWPNDIYAGESNKIGGTLHDFTETGVVIGCGFNLSNKCPTVCLNNIIEEYNKMNGTNLAPVANAVFIANVMNFFDKFFRNFQRGQRSELLELYYKFWIHQDQAAVHVTDDAYANCSVIIRGLDDHGFLLLEEGDTGRRYSIGPKGMSFDLAEKQIKTKIGLMGL